MAPFAATVRYRYSEGDGARDASFRGLFFDRSDEAVLGRLKEVHRSAAWIEIVDLRWHEPRGAPPPPPPPPQGSGSRH